MSFVPIPLPLSSSQRYAAIATHVEKAKKQLASEVQDTQGIWKQKNVTEDILRRQKLSLRQKSAIVLVVVENVVLIALAIKLIAFIYRLIASFEGVDCSAPPLLTGLCGFFISCFTAAICGLSYLPIFDGLSGKVELDREANFLHQLITQRANKASKLNSLSSPESTLQFLDAHRALFKDSRKQQEIQNLPPGEFYVHNVSRHLAQGIAQIQEQLRRLSQEPTDLDLLCFALTGALPKSS